MNRYVVRSADSQGAYAGLFTIIPQKPHTPLPRAVAQSRCADYIRDFFRMAHEFFPIDWYLPPWLLYFVANEFRCSSQFSEDARAAVWEIFGSEKVSCSGSVYLHARASLTRMAYQPLPGLVRYLNNEHSNAIGTDQTLSAMRNLLIVSDKSLFRSSPVLEQTSSSPAKERKPVKPPCLDRAL